MLCATHVVQSSTVRGWVPSPSTERAGVGVQSGGTEITSLSPHPNLPPPGGRYLHGKQVPHSMGARI